MLTDQQVSSENLRAQEIQRLNDEMRGRLQHFTVTVGICALGEKAFNVIARKVRTFKEFSQDNDPWGEHDFGAFDYEGHKIFWKIDYYDQTLREGSPDPADPTVTRRVLTVMLADEY